MSPELNHESENQNHWWDIRKRGTIANFSLKVFLSGVMLTAVGDRLIDHSKDTVNSVMDSKTQQIRQDIQEPMSAVKEDAQKAKESVENIEDSLAELKQWLESQGITFEEPKETDS
jgi:hypothetical protein